MKLNLCLIGLNHKTANVNIRERFALSSFCNKENWPLPKDSNIESLILSTCNRVELLAAGNSTSLKEYLLNNWAKTCNSSVEELLPYIYQYEGLEAAKHIFTVASSLDSMILGEPQILGQLKNAYRIATEVRSTSVILNRLLHKAFSVAKRIRTETAIASSAVSVSYAAVELAKRIFGNMNSKKALLIGAGEMAELAATHLLQAGLNKITIANRTLAKAQELANQFHGDVIAFENMQDCMHETDIIIASTGSTNPIISANDIIPVLKKRNNNPMFFIDIAVPRDIDPNVNNLDNVYLYDIDDLKEVIEENMASRKNEAQKALFIIDEEIENFATWLENLAIQPTILSLIKRSEIIAEEELNRTIKHLGTITDDQKEALKTMLAALIKKFNHAPLTFLKEKTAPHNNMLERINIIKQVFNLHNDS